MSSSSSIFIVEFSKSTQNVGLCLGLSVILIIVFMMTPLNTSILSSIFGKVMILTLLGYTIYYNTVNTNKLVNQFNISITSGNWDVLKTNIVCSYIFSLFLLVLWLSVVRSIFI